MSEGWFGDVGTIGVDGGYLFVYQSQEEGAQGAGDRC